MTSVKINGLAGLYVYFLLLATAWMEDGGYAAWLIPSEFMDVNYGVALKRFLTDRVTLIRAHRFDPERCSVRRCARVLGGAGLPKSCRQHAGMPLSSPSVVPSALPYAGDSIPLSQLRDSRKWTVYPSHAKNDRRTFTDGEGPTLGDFFRIQRGIATGSNKFFVLDRADAERRRFPESVPSPHPS